MPERVTYVLTSPLLLIFPGIVSSGLDKHEVIDLNQVSIEMAEPPAEANPAAKLEGDAAVADDDPMKAMQESVDKDNK